jgi:hypothetical protein
MVGDAYDDFRRIQFQRERKPIVGMESTRTIQMIASRERTKRCVIQIDGRRSAFGITFKHTRSTFIVTEGHHGV